MRRYNPRTPYGFALIALAAMLAGILSDGAVASIQLFMVGCSCLIIAVLYDLLGGDR